MFLTGDTFKWTIYISTAIGFVVGLLVNFNLSIRYVFVTEHKRSIKENFKKFVGTLIIGIAGLGITEVGMYIGTCHHGIHYSVVKVVVAGVVLVWNYLARIFLVFRERR